jgi:hypothetical protein
MIAFKVNHSAWGTQAGLVIAQGMLTIPNSMRQNSYQKHKTS